MRTFRILLCSPEVYPFAKTGGLADASYCLAASLHHLGHDVRVITPKYGGIEGGGYPLEKVGPLVVRGGGEAIEASLWKGRLPTENVPVYFIENTGFFDRAGLYQDEAGQDYQDNINRFAFFSRGVLSALSLLHWKPEVIHCNDWQTALVPVYLKTLYASDPFCHGIATLLTIHNIGYQGVFPKETLPLTGLGWEVFAMDRLEFYDKINLLKGGLVYSDLLNTVSPTYRREIQTAEYGFGLEGLLTARSQDLFGIINGIDERQWDPRTDRYLPHRYHREDLTGKGSCKKALQTENHLPPVNVPLIGMVSRLVDQKGIDLVAETIEELMQLDIQLIILGRGEPRYHKIFQETQENHPEKITVHFTFDEAMAHRIIAGADIFLMPSRYEPCGLNQLYSLRYGTVPIVRRTGGLADTVEGYSPLHIKTGKANGFIFEHPHPRELLSIILLALSVYQNSESWRALIKAGMEKDFSWKGSAQEYALLYEKAIRKIKGQF